MADEAPEAPKVRLDKGADAGEGAGTGWASPYAAPSEARPAPPVNPFAAPGPAAPPSPYAPPPPQQPQSAAVPPPPIAPGGPGQVPYGYPGVPAPAAPAPGYGYPGQPLPPYPAGPGGYGGWPGVQPLPDNGMGTAGLVTGIISAIGFCLGPLGAVMGVLAIVFGAIGRARAGRGQATNGGQALAGIICGAAGVALAVGFTVLIVVASSR